MPGEDCIFGLADSSSGAGLWRLGSPRRDDNGPARWAWSRAHARERPRHGCAVGSARSAAACSRRMFLCCACGALIHRNTAVRATGGCGSRSCSSAHRPARFWSRQRRALAALVSGERVLIVAPEAMASGEVLEASLGLATAALSGDPEALKMLRAPVGIPAMLCRLVQSGEPIPACAHASL